MLTVLYILRKDYIIYNYFCNIICHIKHEKYVIIFSYLVVRCGERDCPYRCKCKFMLMFLLMAGCRAGLLTDDGDDADVYDAEWWYCNDDVMEWLIIYLRSWYHFTININCSFMASCWLINLESSLFLSRLASLVGLLWLVIRSSIHFANKHSFCLSFHHVLIWSTTYRSILNLSKAGIPLMIHSRTTALACEPYKMNRFENLWNVLAFTLIWMHTTSKGEWQKAVFQGSWPGTD